MLTKYQEGKITLTTCQSALNPKSLVRPYLFNEILNENFYDQLLIFSYLMMISTK